MNSSHNTTILENNRIDEEDNYENFVALPTETPPPPQDLHRTVQTIAAHSKSTWAMNGFVKEDDTKWVFNPDNPDHIRILNEKSHFLHPKCKEGSCQDFVRPPISPLRDSDFVIKRKKIKLKPLSKQKSYSLKYRNSMSRMAIIHHMVGSF